MKQEFGFFGLWCAITIVGIYYLVLANTYGKQYTGTLIFTFVNTKYDCSDKKNDCLKIYYVEELFKKDNSTDTCTVERLTVYYSKGGANNAAYNKKLGTKRTIWTRPYNVNTCYDQSIRTFYNQIGGSFIGFSGLMIIFILVVILYEGIKSCFNIRPNTKQNHSFQMI